MASNQGLNSLATIIKRLEAATSRLEDIAEIQAQAAANPGSASSATTHKSLAPSSPPTTSLPPPPAEDPLLVQAYDVDVVPAVQSFVELSGGLNPVVGQQAGHVAKLFNLQRALILQGAACSKPSDSTFQALLGPFGEEIKKIGEIKDSNRSNRDIFNHLCVVAEGIPAIGWVGESPKPAPFIAEMKNAAQFYSNRVVKEYKDKDKKHVDWVKSFDALLESLRKYVLEHHTTGLVWNPKGQDPAKYSASSSAGGPPPPPPPPPPLSLGSSPSTVSTPSPAVGTAAVLAQINRGADVTKGLRKVPKEEMTHKNPSLRASSIVPASPATGNGSGSGPSSPNTPGKKPLRPAKPAALSGKKPSRMGLDGQKWVVDYFENDQSLVIDQCELSQVVNLYGCKNVVLQIKGKVNAITIVNCTKTSVLVESVISAISITSSPSFALQITGKAPTIQIDSTDGGQIFLSKDCLGSGKNGDDGVEITTAKCSAINVSLPEEGQEEGVFVERAVPEMLRSVVKNGQLVTTIVEMSG